MYYLTAFFLRPNATATAASPSTATADTAVALVAGEVAVPDKKLAVVDLTASIMCMENRMPMYVFGLNEENSIVKAMTGEFSGTKVTVS